jgi:phosphoglycolate phosphatase-like HAD superfamily hydrolase
VLRESLAELLGTDDSVMLDAALAHYRERFATIGLYENELYPLVPEALAHHGTHTIGVLRGFGSERELADAGADPIVDTIDPILVHLAAAQPAPRV